MSTLVRHIAGIPTATEQRCVRCCEGIRTLSDDEECCFPADTWVSGSGRIIEMVDCTPYDPHAEGGVILPQEEIDKIMMQAAPEWMKSAK